MESLEPLLRAHPFCEGLADEHLQLLVGCTLNLRFRAGEYLAREAQPAEKLYLIRKGQVALEFQRPGAEPICVETLEAGDVLGVSSITSHAAQLDCRARETVIALGVDRACLTHKMNQDPKLGYAITSRLLELTYARLSRHRLQLLDVYK